MLLINTLSFLFFSYQEIQVTSIVSKQSKTTSITMCCTLMEIYFPNRTALCCTMLILVIAIVQIFQLYTNMYYLLPLDFQLDNFQYKNPVTSWNALPPSTSSSYFPRDTSEGNIKPIDETSEQTYFVDPNQSENEESDIKSMIQQGEADLESQGADVLQHLHDDERSSALETKESDMDDGDRRGLRIKVWGSQTDEIIRFSGTGTQIHLGNKIHFIENEQKSSTLDHHHNDATCLAVTNDTGVQVIEQQTYRNIRYMFDFIPITDDTATNPPHEEYDDDDMSMSVMHHYAVCDFVTDQFAFHFPHTMQQLYRCWSWWKLNAMERDALPVLLFPHAKLPHNEFLEGFVTTLQRAIGLMVLKSDQLETIGLDIDEFGSYKVLSSSPKQKTFVAFVRPRVPPNLVDPKNIFGMLDPTSAYFAMGSVQDARDLRETIVQYLPRTSNSIPVQTVTYAGNGTATPSMAHPLPRIAILNRYNKREILNTDEIQAVLSKNLSLHVPIVYFNESTSFTEQLEFFTTTDILISPHGAQLTGIPFMPNCGALFELFPKGYYLPYYFGSLASAAGLHHSFTSVTEGAGKWKEEALQGMRNRKSRQAVRNKSFCIDPSTILQAIEQLVQSWDTCMRSEHTN